MTKKSCALRARGWKLSSVIRAFLLLIHNGRFAWSGFRWRLETSLKLENLIVSCAVVSSTMASFFRALTENLLMAFWKSSASDALASEPLSE